IIAEGDYRIGYFYYVKGDKRAAAARLIALTRRYPLYSKSDKALWMLADIFEKSEHKEVASVYYGQIIKNYPLSPLVPDAKSRLVSYKVPVPQADPKAVAWMTAEQNMPRQKESFVKKPLALVRTAPHAEYVAAARSGAPNLAPEADNTSATDILTPGNRSQLGGSTGAGTGAVVEVVTPGTAGSISGTTSGGEGNANGGNANGGTDGAQPANEGSPPSPGAAGDPKAAATPPAPPAAPDAATNPVNTTTTTGTGGDAKTDATTPPAADATTDATAKPADGSQDNSKGQKESSSKKKKGLRKVVPW
ncbi:MAG: tetratricopeptide repeat protein, partial [Gemmataceae bacterium]